MQSQFAVLALRSGVWNWLHRLGGPGLILLGIADSSVIPLPGSMDAFTVVLSAHRPQWWPYYGAMATLGAVIGGYLTYRLAVKGGQETLEKKIGKRRAGKVYQRFEKHGFATVFIGSILPPPFPLVPFLMAAGALRYPRNKFLTALAVGRGTRFFALAFIGHIYGQKILGFFSHYYRPLLYLVIALGVAGGVGAIVYLKWYLPKKKNASDDRQELITRA